MPYDSGVLALITLFSVFTWLVIAKLAVLLIDLQLDRASFDGLPQFFARLVLASSMDAGLAIVIAAVVWVVSRSALPPARVLVSWFTVLSAGMWLLSRWATSFSGRRWEAS